MARKTVTDDFQDFPKRLSALMKERGITQEKLAENLGVKRQTVSLYKSGQSMPDAKTLRNLSVFFGISSDYLLGLTDARSTDIDTKSIMKKTGLSENSVKFLESQHTELGSNSSAIGVLNDLLEAPKTVQLLLLISELKKVQKINSDELDFFNELIKEIEEGIKCNIPAEVLKSRRDMLMQRAREIRPSEEYTRFKVIDAFTKLIDTIYESTDFSKSDKILEMDFGF